MSIIHEALKKVQASLERKYGRSSPTKEPVQPVPSPPTAPLNSSPIPTESTMPQTSEAPKQSSGLSTKTIFLLVNLTLISICIAIVLALKVVDRPKVTIAPTPQLVQQRLNQQRPVVVPAQAPQPVQPLQQSIRTSTPVVAATPVAQKPKPIIRRSRLKLDGIMAMENRRVALINGEIYEEGEYVDGQKIAEITLKEVHLINEGDGTKSTLSVRNRR